MKKLGLSIALIALLTFGATPALVQTTHAAPAPPIQGVGPHQIIMYVDTVTGGGTPKPAATCLQQNQFIQGQTVVFRMYAYDVPAGGLALTASNIREAYVSIPGKGNIALKWNGATAAQHHTPAYFEAAWMTAGYPVGTVNFSVTVVAKPLAQWGLADFATSTVPAQTGVYRQGFGASSNLTIVAP
jgi:hypothetical protein